MDVHGAHHCIRWRNQLVEGFVMEYRNARYNADGTIDCELNHPRFGWVAFTANPNDVEEFGRAMFEAIVANGDVAPYQP
jgi:hypothetical protein